jgi:hypothetical protein
MKEKTVSDKQLFVLYTVVLVVWVGSFALMHTLLKPPTSAEGYANQLCQELYGPQTGATWEKGSLMCETARGEIIEVRRVK